MDYIKIPLSQLEEVLASDNSTGFCLKCGNEQYGCEPDARKYLCGGCTEAAVYGAEEIMLMGMADENK